MLDRETIFTHEPLMGHLDSVFVAGTPAAALFQSVMYAGMRQGTLTQSEFRHLMNKGSALRAKFTLAVPQFMLLRWTADPLNAVDMLPLCPKCGAQPRVLVADAKTMGMRKALDTFKRPGAPEAILHRLAVMPLRRITGTSSLCSCCIAVMPTCC